LIFIFTSWDADRAVIKSVVARYSTGNGIKSEFLVPKIREIITALYVYGFIVNNVSGDGATENKSAFKQLAMMMVREVFKSHCSNWAVSSRNNLRYLLLDNLPNEKLLIAFLHPCDNCITVFIGGEMSHWTKKLVNRLERSNDGKSKVCLKFRGQALSLKLIKQAWLWDDEGFGSIRKTVLTEDHFYKKA